VEDDGEFCRRSQVEGCAKCVCDIMRICAARSARSRG
jgi:hypothetical protein